MPLYAIQVFFSALPPYFQLHKFIQVTEVKNGSKKKEHEDG